MSKRGWFRRWRHRRRWKRAERNQEGPLREFVYLDEVSVYSLVASQVGLIVTELTETQATSLQSEVSAAVGASAPFAKAEVGSKVQTGETQSSQVLRKAIIQTTFKQLHETATRSGALRLGVADADMPAVETLETVKRLGQDDPRSSWVVDPGRLRRGDLLEMEVQLEAEPIFQADAVISGVLELIQDDPAAFGVRDLGELGQVRLVSRMVEKMLAGLVPVRGRAANYEAVELDGAEWLVHTALTAQLAERPAKVRPLFLVGVAQQALFWKDVRRVLFSGSSYRVLARLTRSGLQPSWTPVKLVDVLRDVIPDFADAMDTLNRGVLPAMSSAIASGENDSAHRVHRATVAYASFLADRASIEVSEDELRQAGLLDTGFKDSDRSVRDWRAMLAPVTDYIEQRTGGEVDRELAADYRVAAVTQAGLLDPTPSAASIDSAPPVADERFLDSEIVAVYW